MRKIVLGLLVCSLFLIFCSLSFADLNQFTGNWVNTDPGTRGLTALDIQSNGNSTWVQAWGKASPNDIDWGKVTAYAYAPSVDSNLHATAQAISATYQTNFSQTILIIKASGNNQLQVDLFTRFTDNSGRSSYTNTYYFRHGNYNNNNNNNNNNPGPIHFGIATPRQTSPVSGSIFNNYPRRTVLDWEPVNNAASYTVEIDCFGCAQANRWSADVGQPYKIVPGLTTTSYVFNFVGAQPGRWRVWAVASNGQESAKSPWWEFRYTR